MGKRGCVGELNSSHARRLRPLPLRERRQLSVDAPSSVEEVAIETAAQIAPQMAAQIADEIAAESAAEIGHELGRSIPLCLPSEQSAASEAAPSRQSRESRAAGEARATCGAQRESHPPSRYRPPTETRRREIQKSSSRTRWRPCCRGCRSLHPSSAMVRECSPAEKRSRAEGLSVRQRGV